MLKRFWWVFLVMAAVGTVGGLLVASVITYVMPKKYESEAVIEVRPLEGEGDFQGSGEGRETPVFLEVAVKDIKSREGLGEVAENLKLIRRWSVDRDASIQMLENAVNPQNIRASSLISIRVRHTDKMEARDIAVEVAKVYKAKRDGIERRDRKRGLEELNQVVKDQEDKVEEVRKVLSSIEMNRAKNIVVEGNVTLLHLPVSPQEADAKRDLETDQELLTTMKLAQGREMISAKIPEESVIIHEEAQIAQAPISPNVPLSLLVGATLGFLLSPLVALWLIRQISDKEGGASAHEGWPQPNPP